MQGGPLDTQLDSLRDASKATDQGSLLLSFPKGGCVVSYGVVLVKIRIKCTGFGRVLATKRTISRSDESLDASTIFYLMSVLLNHKSIACRPFQKQTYPYLNLLGPDGD